MRRALDRIATAIFLVALPVGLAAVFGLPFDPAKAGAVALVSVGLFLASALACALGDGPERLASVDRISRDLDTAVRDREAYLARLVAAENDRDHARNNYRHYRERMEAMLRRLAEEGPDEIADALEDGKDASP